jgi:hypothetical protein
MNREYGVNFRCTYPLDNESCHDMSRIYRGGSFDHYGEHGSLQSKFRIGAMFDLRNKSEINANYDAIRYFHFPMIADTRMPDIPDANDYVIYYQQLIMENKHVIRDLLLTLKSTLEDTSCLIGCHAGKDRTGVICYLVHRIVGTSEQLIRQDYVASKEGLMHREDVFIDNARKRNLTFAAYRERFQLCEQVYDGFDDWFKSEYPVIQNFCEDLNLKNDFINQIKRTLRVS